MVQLRPVRQTPSPKEMDVATSRLTPIGLVSSILIQWTGNVKHHMAGLQDQLRPVPCFGWTVSVPRQHFALTFSPILPKIWPRNSCQVSEIQQLSFQKLFNWLWIRMETRDNHSLHIIGSTVWILKIHLNLWFTCGASEALHQHFYPLKKAMDHTLWTAGLARVWITTHTNCLINRESELTLWDLSGVLLGRRWRLRIEGEPDGNLSDTNLSWTNMCTAPLQAGRLCFPVHRCETLSQQHRKKLHHW